MELSGKACRMTVYLGESDRYNGVPAYQSIVELLRSRGVAGATVTRGIHGYGHRSLLHSASILRLSEDLPLLIVVVDSEDRLRPLLPEVRSRIKGGLITLEDVECVGPA